MSEQTCLPILARSQGVSDLPSRVIPPETSAEQALPSAFTPLCLSVLRLGLLKTLYS